MELQNESARTLCRLYRKAVQKALLLLTIFAGMMFVGLNLAKARWPLSLAEIGLILFPIYVLHSIRDFDRVERWALLLSCVFMAITAVLTGLPNTSAVQADSWGLVKVGVSFRGVKIPRKSFKS